MTLEENLRKSGALLKKAPGKILPVLEREEKVSYHIEEILANDPSLRERVEGNDDLYNRLTQYVESAIDDYRWDLEGAKLVDSFDRVTAGIELGAGLFGPEAEVGVKLATEPLEALVKIPYIIGHTITDKDWAAPLYFSAVEALSLVPYAGEIVDVLDLYVYRVRRRLQKKAAKNFKDYLAGKQEPANNNEGFGLAA